MKQLRVTIIKIMGINKGKHVVQEIEGVRCTVVESGINTARTDFLKDILLYNKFDVKVAPDKTPDTFILGVTDIIFNPVIAIYERTLFSKEGKHITPEYWNQKCKEIHPYYWKNK